jgi:hypothetical protein
VLVRSAMFAFLTKLLLVARSRLKSRASLEAENLVLRQQVIVLSRKFRSRLLSLLKILSQQKSEQVRSQGRPAAMNRRTAQPVL